MPYYAERIWIPLTSDMQSIGKGKALKGKVLNNWPPFGLTPESVTEIEPVKSCIEHWSKGVEWEKTQVFNKMKSSIETRGKTDGCKNMKDVYKRYQKLDAIFDQVKKEHRIKCQQEVQAFSFRESGGINFHIGPNGEPFFGRLGQHRLAMALVLGIKQVPAELGAIHVDALPLLPDLRIPS